MSHYLILAWDAPDVAALRSATRDNHLAHIAQIVESVAIAGPLRDEKGAIAGSMFILIADMQAEAEALLRRDPYFAAGVWAKWTINPFTPVAGEWTGGGIW